MLRRWIFLVFAIVCLNGLCPSQSADPALDQGLHLLEEGRTTLNDSSLTQARDYFAKLTQEHADNALYFYQLARVDQYRCNAYLRHGDKKNGEHALDSAIASVQQSIKLNDNSADAHSQLADLYGQKIGMGVGMFAGPKYGPKVKAENERALSLDAKNPRVYASLGRQYFMAPKMFGGDNDKAIESFRKSTQLDPQADETYVWLAMALEKKRDAYGANQALRTALKLNPRSALAQKMCAQLCFDQNVR
jgi:tetratricopeptide (TPR) repeat protein